MDDETTAPDLTNRVLPDGLTVRHLIARGGMSLVYEARTSAGELVALKLLAVPGGITDEFLRRFERELAVTGTLDHPNIVRVSGSGMFEGHPYLVMEHLRGQPLSMVIVAYPDGLSIERTVSIAHAICAALSHAHALGVVHRDIKPANVFCCDDGRIVLTDFGLTYVTGATTLTAGDVMIGTPAFMSPEAFVGLRATHRSDIYQMGLLLYYMLTGKTYIGPWYARLRAPDYPVAIPLGQRRPDTPSWLVATVERCLRDDPDDRYPSITALFEDLTMIDSTEIQPRPPAILGADAATTAAARNAPTSLSERPSVESSSPAATLQTVSFCLQSPPNHPDRLIVTVEANQVCEAILICRTNKELRAVQRISPDHVHEFRISGLAPATRYRFVALLVAGDRTFSTEERTYETPSSGQTDRKA